MQESILWTTNGTGDGAADITQAQWIDFYEMLFLRDKTVQGVAQGYLNALAVSSSGNNNATVASGGAVVRGFLYRSTAAVAHTISTPLADTGFRVVLRADWATQTVRSDVVMNTTGVTDPPALTQSELTEWEISLGTGTITSGGVIAVTSAPTYLYYNTKVKTVMIDDEGVTADKIAAAVAGDGLAGGAGAALSVTVDNSTVEISADTLRIKALGVNTGQIANLAVTEGKLAADAVSTDKVLDDAITSAKILDIYSNFTERLGSSSTDWSLGGVTDYHPTDVDLKLGVAEFSIDAGNDSGGAVITFDTAFSGAPTISLTMGSSHVTGNSSDFRCAVPQTVSIAANAMTIRAYRRDPADNADAWTVRVHWQAWNGS